MRAQWGLGGEYHRSPQPPPPGLPADCRTALGARPQKLQPGLPWAAAASPPCVRRLLCSLSSPHVRLHVGAPWSWCSAPGSALSCQVATGQPGASEEGAGCLLFALLSCFSPTFTRRREKIKTGSSSLWPTRKEASSNERECLIKARQRCCNRLF